MTKAKRPAITPRFQPGAKVRVKRGVRDPDFPDVPLGGWAGTVKEVIHAKGEVTYLFAWERATLGMQPAFRRPRERDGQVSRAMRLGGEKIHAELVLCGSP